MSNKLAKSGLVPKLRFPEFREAEAWGTQPLRNVAQLLDGDWIESKDQSTDGVRLIQTGNIGIGDFIPKDGNARFISEETFRRLKCTEVVPGDCLISRLPDPAGRSCLVPDMGSKMITAVDCTIVRFNLQEIVPYLFISFSQTDHYFSEVQAQASGSTRLRISRENLSNIEVPRASLPEQQKIADCLASLDQRITLEAQKLDTLKTHKKGLMQQLFPAEGETLPKLRFPEFLDAGEWKEEKLITLSNEPLSNGVFNDPKKVGSGYKLINVSDMYIDTVIDEGRLSLLELSRFDFEANQVKHGDIFFTRSSLVKSGIAVSNIYLGCSGDVTFDGHLIRFRANTNKVLPLFAHYLFKTTPIRAQLIARGKSATMTTIGQADVASVVLFYPEKEEQQKIADCLSSLDDLITAQTEKLTALKTHKKGLMQQLFPSVGGVARSDGVVVAGEA